MELEHDEQIEVTFFKDVYGQDVNGFRRWQLSRLYSYLQTPKVIGHDETEKTRNGIIVSGYVAGDRKEENVRYKNIIIIDIDDLPEHFDLFEHVKDRFKNAFAIYSTYKHTNRHGRYRLLIPINRNLTPKQYEVLMKQIIIGVELTADEGSYQPSRAFALPVVKEAHSDYVFKYQDSAFMNVSDEHIKRLDSMATRQKTDIQSYTTANNDWREVLQPKSDHEGRNEATTKVVGSLLRHYVDVDLAYYLTRLWNEHHHEPLDTEEFNKAFKSIHDREMQRRAEAESELSWND